MYCRVSSVALLCECVMFIGHSLHSFVLGGSVIFHRF